MLPASSSGVPYLSGGAWPEPARFALGLLLSFGLGLGAAWLWGRVLVEATLPFAQQTILWLEVTTTVEAMLQPLVLAIGLAGAGPGRMVARCLRVAIAAMLGVAFLLIDLPVTLHAYIWDMFHAHYDPQGFSPLLVWHEFMHAGGRLGMGVLLGVSAAGTGSWLAERYRRASAPKPG